MKRNFKLSKYRPVSLQVQTKQKKNMSEMQSSNRNEVVSHDGKIVLIKWSDNLSPLTTSNFVGVRKKDEVERWEN